MEKIASEIQLSYKKKALDRINLLREQAEAARTSGSGENAVLGAFVSSPANVNAINLEIALLEAENFAPKLTVQLIDFETAKRAILQNADMKHLRKAFEASPISSSKFTAAQYDVHAAQIIPQTNRAKVLILFSVMGVMLGLCVLAVRNALLTKGV